MSAHDAVLALMRHKWVPQSNARGYWLNHPSNMIAAMAVSVLVDAGFTIEGPAEDRGSATPDGPYWSDARLEDLLTEARAHRGTYDTSAPAEETSDEFAGLAAADGEAGLW